MIALPSVNTMLEKKYARGKEKSFSPLVMAYLGIIIDKDKGVTMRLIEYLKKEGITQAKFARKIKMSPAGVCRIIKGNRFPRPETILAIDFWTQGQVTHDDFYKEAQANKQSDVSQV